MRGASTDGQLGRYTGSGPVDERFHAQYHGLPIPTYIWQYTGTSFVMRDCNDAADRMNDGRSGQLLGKTSNELFGTTSPIVAEIERSFVERTTFSREMTHRLIATGATRELNVTYVFVPPDLVLVHTEDITERRRMEAALRAEGERLAAVVATQNAIAMAGNDLPAMMHLVVERARELTRAGGAVVDLAEGDEMVCHAVSGTAATHLGLRLKIDGSLSGRCVRTGEILECVDSELDPRVDRAASQRIGVRSLIVVPLCTHGVTCGVLKVFSAVPSAFDERDVDTLQLMAGLVGAALSNATAFETKQALLTGRTDALAALEASAARFRSLVQNAADVIGVIDATGITTYQSPSVERVLGYHPDELIGRNSLWLLHPEDEARVYQLLGGTRSPASPTVMEFRVRHKDGSWRVIEANSTNRLHDPAIGGIVINYRDVTERKRAEDVQRRLAVIVESSADAILSATLDERILSWNPAAELLYGYAADEMVGQLKSILVPPDRLEETQLLLERVAQGERIVQHETVRRRKDGTLIDVALSYAPLSDTTGVIAGFSVIARDISERKQIDRMKNEFISTVSHELRTPLTSILGALGLVAGGVTGSLPVQAQTMLDIAYTNSERLGRLINDILDIEKIESGKLRFDRKRLTLMPLVEQAIEANRAYAGPFGVIFTLTQTVADAVVYTDPDRLMQVLTNLLSNAAKFSPRDGVVTVAVTREAEIVRIAVGDQGSGVPLEFHARIFQKFAQADSSDTRQKGGTGLGLNITKAIIERLGGQIGFTSVPGAGASFFVDLPLIEGQQSMLK
ncbi:MAG: PAS domain S-box protein [Herpetosiphonaceae bacterium]|nr:PAS domain S-box protein [Herpetosiphonaceae bacterium]